MRSVMNSPWHQRGLVLSLVASAEMLGACCSHESDEALLERFNEQRAAFEQLLSFCKPAVASEPDPDRAQDQASSSSAKCLQRASELGVIDVRRWRPDRLAFVTTECGVPITTSTKGYCYLDQEPRFLVDNLDRYASRQSRDTSTSSFRVIGDGWYLCYRPE